MPPPGSGGAPSMAAALSAFRGHPPLHCASQGEYAANALFFSYRRGKNIGVKQRAAKNMVKSTFLGKGKRLLKC